jgi:two-component system, sensor histidine kinase and response regulator
VERILIVDDHDVFRTAVCDLLAVAQPQARVLQAQNGRECIDLALAEKPDVILMDARMPELDGYEATKTLRTLPETERIPVIAMTSEMDGGSVPALRELCNGFLLKPFCLDDLIWTLGQVDHARGSLPC